MDDNVKTILLKAAAFHMDVDEDFPLDQHLATLDAACGLSAALQVQQASFDAEYERGYIDGAARRESQRQMPSEAARHELPEEDAQVIGLAKELVDSEHFRREWPHMHECLRQALQLRTRQEGGK